MLYNLFAVQDKRNNPIRIIFYKVTCVMYDV